MSPWRVVVSICWGTIALGSGLALAALAAWLIARAWQMPPVLDLSVAVVAVRALGISRGLFRYIERLATHDVALRAMTTARTAVYSALARTDIWSPRRDGRSESNTGSAERGGDSARSGSSSAPTRSGRGNPRDAGPVAQQRRSADHAGLRRREELAPADSGIGAGRETGLLRRGDLLTRIGADIDDLGAVIVRAVVPIAVAILLSLAAVALLATISVPAGVILAVALLVSGGFAPWLSARAARDAELAVQSDRAEFRAAAVTVLDHAPELRVAGRLETAMTAATTAAERAVRAEDRAASRSAWAAAATPLSIGASVLGALLIGIVLYGNGFGATAEPLQPAPAGGISPMAFAILVLLPLSAFEAVGALPAAAQALTKGRAALRRIRALDSSAPADYASGDLRARLTRALPDLPPGRRIAVVGPSGAGKTTLLMSWAGLFDTPRSGRTFFAEDAHVFGTSVLENLRVARGDVTDAEAESALRAVGSGPWLDTLPEGLETDLVGGAAALSGGQRRRLLLARALVAPADTLLLDEPTEHMEATAGAELLRALLDETSGLVDPDRTVVVVTHQLPADHRADTVVTVAPGGEISITRRVAA
ncbi:thiol reductant ABC exporter subunit CydC [Nocardia africana]|uniref:Thiol reductant ABC exporter subunit CydC n=1 Tax=Nocardia africana TaxID=134964 RepID=A0ABW6NA97_9NOCA